VYAYLALGDAYERSNNSEKALSVYKDLLGLGVKVHGLKEKILHLENILATNAKRDFFRIQKEKD
jgi:hypothetical protein